MSCKIKHCRGESSLNYLGNPICDKHWNWYCDEDKPFDIVRIFNIQLDGEGRSK
tara:strand:+ start:468 stop:629 length:162 start_codon:yes stop_codon:yes gene_type:complete